MKCRRMNAEKTKGVERGKGVPATRDASEPWTRSLSKHVSDRDEPGTL